MPQRSDHTNIDRNRIVHLNGEWRILAYQRPAHSTPSNEQNTRHELYSCTKSFISALVGIAIAGSAPEGVDESVLACFPTHNFANLDTRKSTMTIEQLNNDAPLVALIEDFIVPAVQAAD